ncbi:protein 175-like isoform X1 [Vespula maculifrons]|uniref:Protein 175-like isoform X1 n=1 Tax=Vespula maculifrons TaxID=7453 RepID=A0ABD2CQA4_VESMC
MKERENKIYVESMNSESYEEQTDPITILRKEIQDWRNHKEFNDMDDVYTTSSQKNDLPESQNENIYSNDDVTTNDANNTTKNISRVHLIDDDLEHDKRIRSLRHVQGLQGIETASTASNSLE